MPSQFLALQITSCNVEDATSTQIIQYVTEWSLFDYLSNATSDERFFIFLCQFQTQTSCLKWILFVNSQSSNEPETVCNQEKEEYTTVEFVNVHPSYKLYMPLLSVFRDIITMAFFCFVFLVIYFYSKYTQN